MSKEPFCGLEKGLQNASREGKHEGHESQGLSRGLAKGFPMKKKEHLKRPAALPQPGQGGMSLEEKMELFQKSKNQNIQSWLDSLTKGQREAM